MTLLASWKTHWRDLRLNFWQACYDVALEQEFERLAYFFLRHILRMM